MTLDSRVYSAVIANKGLWPKDLVSGVMFYNGCKITVADFVAAGGKII